MRSPWWNFAITEGVRQLRGEAAAQVGDPQISVILGNAACSPPQASWS